MVQHCPTDPLDQQPDESFTFTDVTMLAFLAASALAIAVLILLGAETAVARLAAVLGLA